MNKRVNTVLLSTALFSVMVMTLASCMATRQEAALKTLQAVSATVDKAATAIADLRALGKIDDTTWNKVVTLKVDYEKAMVVAVAAVNGDMTKWAPDDVNKAADAFVQLVLTLTKKTP